MFSVDSHYFDVKSRPNVSKVICLRLYVIDERAIH